MKGKNGIFKLKINKQSNSFFKKTYYVMIIILNFEGEELRTIVNIIHQITRINKKTCYNIVKDLRTNKLVKENDELGKRILTVPESAKQRLYDFILPIIPLIYRHTLSEIFKRRSNKINYNESLNILDKYNNEVKILLKDIFREEYSDLPRDFSEKFYQKFEEKLQSHLEEKVAESVLY